MTSRLPFTQVNVDALRDASLCLQARGLYAVLRSFDDPGGGKCFPSLETLSEACGVHRTTVMRLLAKLEASGWVVADKRTGAGNQYTFPASRTGATSRTNATSRTGARQPVALAHTTSRTGATLPIANTKNQDLEPFLVEADRAAPKQKRKATVAQQPPTLAEVEVYASEQGRADLAAQFVDHHTAGGWKVGRGPMLDWRAAFRTWARNDEKWNPRSAPTNGKKRMTPQDFLDL